MDAQSIRAAAMATPRKTQDLSTPFWPGTDGTIVIADQDMSILTDMSSMAKSDPAGYRAALIVQVLASKETLEPAFQLADRDWIKSQASVCMALVKPINEFFGFNAKDAVEEAKND